MLTAIFDEMMTELGQQTILFTGLPQSGTRTVAGQLLYKACSHYLE